MLEFAGHLWKYPLDSFPRKCVARILRKLFFAEIEIVVIIKLPEFDVYNIEILITEEIFVIIDVRLILNIE